MNIACFTQLVRINLFPNYLILGHQIGIRNISTGKINFFALPDFVHHVTHIALSPNKKTLFVCEHHQQHSPSNMASQSMAENGGARQQDVFLSIYDLKNPDQPRHLKAHINITELITSNHNAICNVAPSGAITMSIAKESQQNQSNQKDSKISTQKTQQNRKGGQQHVRHCSQISFSADTNSKIIAMMIQENPTDSRVILLDWMSMKLKSTLLFPGQLLKKVTFNPGEKDVLVTTGANHFRVWKIVDGAFKPQQQYKINQQHIYSEHIWLDKKDSGEKKDMGDNYHLLAFSQEGEMFLYDSTFEDTKQTKDSAFQAEDSTHVIAVSRFSKGFLVSSNKGDMAMWVRSEENNSTSGKEHYDFIRKWTPAITKNQQILGSSVSGNEEKLAVALDNNNIALIDIKSVGLNEDTEREIKSDLICKGFHSGGITAIDVAVQRPILVTASRDDSTVRLWNYLTGVCELAREYYVVEDAAIRAQAKPLSAVAIHPSGYQLAIAFIDKVLIHHILNDDLKKTSQIELRQVNLLKYSTGGQYLFVIERSNVNVFNAYTFQKIESIRVETSKVQSIVFAQNDKAFAVVGQDGYIGRWYLPSFKKIFESGANIKDDKWTGYRDISFVHDSKEPMMKAEDQLQLCVVGTDGQSQKLKILNQHNKVTNNQFYSHDSGELTRTMYVKTPMPSQNKQINGFVSGSDSGQLQLLLHPYLDGGISKYIVHQGQVTALAATPDFKMLFSASADGSIFLFNVGEERINIESAQEKAEEMCQELPKIMDSELSQIVLVSQQEMLMWQRKQHKLQLDLAQTRQKVESKLEECKSSYKLQLEEIERQKELDIKDLKKRFEDLKSQKEIQEKQNKQATVKLERYHYQEVKELEELYQKKLSLEENKYLETEQNGLECKQAYDKRIEHIKKENESAIRKLLEEFKVNLLKVQQEMRESQKVSLDLKVFYTERLDKHEDEHEVEIEDKRDKHKTLKKNLEDEWKILEDKQTHLKAEKDKLHKERNEAEILYKEAQGRRFETNSVLTEKKKQICLLEAENEEVIEKLKKRATDLYKYKFKIKDLRKSKHVLTHRTQEMRASLEPKDDQIDSLQYQLFNLEQVFEELLTKMNKLGTELTKDRSKIKSKKNDLRKQRQETKDRKAFILKFAQDVHKIVSTKDDKAYVTGIMKLNQDYVMSQSAYTGNDNKREKEVIHELSTQLTYMEESMAQNKCNAVKNQKRVKTDIKKKTKENTSLIMDLNAIKFEDKRGVITLKNRQLDHTMLQSQNERLKRQENNLRAELASLQSNSAGPGAAPAEAQKKSGSLKVATGGASGSLKEQNMTSEEEQDKMRVNELNIQLEENNEEIMRNKEEINNLKIQIMTVLKQQQAEILQSQGQVVPGLGQNQMMMDEVESQPL